MLDKLLDDARKEFDQAKQDALYQQACQIMNDDLPNLYLWQTKATEAGVATLKKSLAKTDINRGFEEKVPEKKDDKPVPTGRPWWHWVLVLLAVLALVALKPMRRRVMAQG